MNGLFLNFFCFIDRTLGGSGVFLACVFLIFVAFIVVVSLSLFKSGYNLKKRAWFACFCVGAVLLQYGLSFFVSGGKGYVVLTLSLCVFKCIAVYLIREKKTDNRAKNFARSLDQKISRENITYNINVEPSNTPSLEGAFEEDLPAVIKEKKDCSKQTKTKTDIDFSHVKSVLKRLDFYSLSPTEKKMASELESLIESAQTDGVDTALKRKINDGLGALLKIMSKYGV